MRTTWMALLLCLLLTACGAAEMETVSGPSKISPAAFLALQTPPEPDLSYTDPVDPAPWRTAYIHVLENAAAAEGPVRQAIREGRELSGEKLAVYYDSTCRFALYDIDKDGVSEFFLHRGTCEADYHVEVYAAEGDEARLLAACSFGHSSLYSCPGENGVVIHGGHMGGAWMQKLSLVDGEIQSEDMFSEYIVGREWDGYTPVSDFVPGAEPVPFMQSVTTFPRYMAQSAYIYQYGLPIVPGGQPEEAETAVQAVLEDGAEFYAVPSRPWYDCPGWTTLAGFCRKGVPDRFSRRRTVTRFAWVDLDNDGQLECVLCLEDDEGSSSRLILRFQDGVVYGYSLRYSREEVKADGLFYEESNGYCLFVSRLFFYKNQFQQIYDDSFDEAFEETAPEADWKPFLTRFPAAAGDPRFHSPPEAPPGGSSPWD